MAIGLDASLPLRKDDTYNFYVLNKTTSENIKQNIKMLLLTAPGERVMLPDYGVGLRNFLFENTPEYEISEKIRKQVARYLNNITIVTLYVGKNNENTLIVKMVYAINGTNVKEAIELIETRVT
tara:strand:+ start:294 stop:665 length:372 start_codon:yes stop_codon:yes gene_type:complete